MPRFPTRLPANANLVLGHRRLAILDLTPAGHGPMSWGDGRAWLTYNGEIYNYVELKRELVSLGHSFRTQTDTEVLLASYAEWGEAALSRLNGMWAFGLYDVERQRLFCARDRFGIKPFYYHQDETLFMFASEIKALLAHPRAPRQAAHDELISFLTRGRLDEGEATFFRGIRSLPAGHCLSFDLATQRTAVRRWYDLEPSQPGHEPEEIGELLEDSIRLRLRSDVEVGTCLSGGLDSSAIVTTIAALDAGAASSHRSFSVLYDEPGLDESGFVDQVLAATGSRGERTSATSRELVEELPSLVQAQDEPIPSAGPYSQWRVMKLAHRAGIKVLLDGQGADELLAGYHYQLGPFLAELLTTRGPARALAALRRLRATTGRPSWFLAGLMGYHVVPLPESLRRVVAARFVTHSYVPRALISPDVRHDLGAPVSRRLEPCRDLAEERRRGLTLTSLPALLRYEDRNSMAFHIEARTPFLDYRLVEKHEVERDVVLQVRQLFREGVRQPSVTPHRLSRSTPPTSCETGGPRPRCETPCAGVSRTPCDSAATSSASRRRSVAG